MQRANSLNNTHPTTGWSKGPKTLRIPARAADPAVDKTQKELRSILFQNGNNGTGLNY